MDYSRIKLLSFDCYGTLIDWRTGVLNILGPFFCEFMVGFSRKELFDAFLRADKQINSGEYRSYREVLAETVLFIADELRIFIDPKTRYVLSEKFDECKPFEDTVECLKILKKKYRLAIISNVDDDLFAISHKMLEVEFDHIITAEQLGSYKPSENNFKKAMDIFGLEKEECLHVAQSIYHDIVPTNSLGWNNVWINRYDQPERSLKKEFPDLEVPDISSLVKILELETA
jgi:2-haloacid dehalogenase